MIKSFKTIAFLAFCFLAQSSLWSQSQPNILVLIADDMGIDAFSPYGVGTDGPVTPHLVEMKDSGLLFSNTYAYSTCAPSRASIMTGRYGNKTGMVRSGLNMNNTERTIFEYIDSTTNGAYANALLGKWHLGNNNPLRPNNQGIQHYDGNLDAAVDDYFVWERTVNGTTLTSTEYVTSYITDQAINWIDTVNGPWFLWMAYNAPHGPVHLPPDSLYTRTDTSTQEDKYFCMIESVDHEIARLYSNMTQAQKDSTFIVFIGDNGTPGTYLQGYPRGHGKTTVYEGGIRVPMFVTGYGVERIGETEDGLVAGVDLFATIMELLGENYPGGYHNSLSLKDVLTDANATTRPYNYSEQSDGGVYSRAIRDAQYKLIIREENSNTTMEFYDLLVDPLEFTELTAGGLSIDQQSALDNLKTEADSIYLSWSCNDLIQNGDEEGIDCGGSSCQPCQPNSIGNSLINPGFSMYPNPTKDRIQIQINAGSYVLKIYNPLGQEVLSQNIEGDAVVQTSSLTSGMYIAEVTNQITSQKSSSKFIIE